MTVRNLEALLHEFSALLATEYGLRRGDVIIELPKETWFSISNKMSETCRYPLGEYKKPITEIELYTSTGRIRIKRSVGKMKLLDAWREACDGELKPGACKIYTIFANERVIFIPHFVDNKGNIYGLNQDKTHAMWLGTSDLHWEICQEPPKLVKWYRPRVIWREGYNPELFVDAPYDRTKNGFAFITTKVLEWDEIDAPATFGEVK